MNSKWFYSTLILVLAIATAFLTQQQPSMPNQAIVLELHNTTDSHYAKKAIAKVERQLFKLGVENVVVNLLDNGNYKLTYFSNLEVTNVKLILEETETFDFKIASGLNSKSSELPIKKDDFSLNIYEISIGNDSDSGLEGKSAVEVKTDFNRFSNAEKFLSHVNTIEFNPFLGLNVTYKFQTEIEFSDDNLSLSLPESRAGPISFSDSNLC